ncbi:helix-turn-helix domain-containing protein [Streptomyces melanogenes]|uniref:AraC-like ligand-binding domain-containing protein n=1 Tax=Streptomyces melanogenes TaxID=67326 RepID=UPI00167EEE2C|nr:helix-turn-helix domain-containing protein [Streptomyces melanogenes]GGP33124.1 AraC family transcriptional regulator [Streptomyces melanogenes]
MGWSQASADAVAPGDRFEWFRETLSTELMPVALRAPSPADFRAEISHLDLGVVQMSTFTFSAVSSRRSRAHVRQGDPEQYQLALVTQGAFRTAQLGNESLVTGGLVLTNTSRPMETTCRSGDGGQAQAVMLQIPRSALPLRSDRVDRLIARHLGAGGGTAAILADFLATLIRRGPTCRPEELRRMGSVALDLATACLAQQLDAPEEIPADARAQVMLRQVLRFIDDNLGDPTLTPQLVADRHHISLRGLYALFRDQPASVAESIRRRRLARCHADLARPELGHQSVQAIAARWGFVGATAFSRAFREAYGITPTEHRAATRRPGIARNVEKPSPQVART